jgi:hypothetical protein
MPTTNGHVAYSRVTEGFAVAIVTEDPCEGANRQLRLARLILGNGHWIVDETFCREFCNEGGDLDVSQNSEVREELLPFNSAGATPTPHLLPQLYKLLHRPSAGRIEIASQEDIDLNGA